jgi:choline dehydrogenase
VRDCGWGENSGIVFTPVVMRRLWAEREIILCGGAVNSPQLLMLSGIGPADHLSSLGIPVVLDASEVGRNLQNHPSYALRYACSQIRSMPGAKR